MSDFNEYNYLCHYGVLGMKWGVRRYQNADGSLTAAGRRHYGRTAMKAANEMHKSTLSIKTARKKGGKYYKPLSKKYYKREAELDQLLYKNGKVRNNPIKEVFGERKANKLTDEDHSVVELLESRQANALDRIDKEERVKKEKSQKAKQNAKIMANAKEFDSPGMKALNSLNGPDYTAYRAYRNGTDKTLVKTVNKAADLGIKVLSKNDKGLIYDPTDPWNKEHGYTKESFDKNMRNWFLFEDQTIGMPQVAMMISEGVPAKRVETLIKAAENTGSMYDNYNLDEIKENFRFGAIEGNYKNLLVNFAYECEEAKKK